MHIIRGVSDNRIWHEGPFNQWTGQGDENDSAQYILKPGENFYQPWLYVPGGRGFVWPLGIEGFSLSIEPQLGIHRYIGDNAVKVDVIHKGEERISLTGSFPGKTAVDAFQALRDIVYADTPARGKILYLPHILTYTQRVVIASARFDRGQDERGTDLTYDLEFVRLGPEARVNDPVVETAATQPTSGPKSSARSFKMNGSTNTIRKLAALKLKDASKWRQIYNLNTALFRRLNVPAYKAPDHRLPLGTKVYY